MSLEKVGYLPVTIVRLDSTVSIKQSYILLQLSACDKVHRKRRIFSVASIIFVLAGMSSLCSEGYGLDN
jgi:hypothetical protein